MSSVLVLFGGAVCALGAWGVAYPLTLARAVERAWSKPWTFPLAIAARLGVGVAALLAAPATRFPLAFRVVGALGLLAAGGLALSGRARVRAFAAWWARRSPFALRLAWAAACAFGALLALGAVPDGIPS